jgi:thymidylate kinase
MAPIIISIEGNIGSGKSTFLEELRKAIGENANVIFLKEVFAIVPTAVAVVDDNDEAFVLSFVFALYII